MFISGRDNRYRPILVLNIYKIDPKALPKEALLKGIDYMS